MKVAATDGNGESRRIMWESLCSFTHDPGRAEIDLFSRRLQLQAIWHHTVVPC